MFCVFATEPITLILARFGDLHHSRTTQFETDLRENVHTLYDRRLTDNLFLEKFPHFILKIVFGL